MTHRILVTGSRTWTAQGLLNVVLNALLSELGSFTLVHGTARGADAQSDAWARLHPEVTVERHPAKWSEHGRRAGFIRNQQMIDSGVDLCLAFIKDNSRGATHCADAAERAGIEVRRWDA